MVTVAYLSHSLGTGNGDEAVRRQDNIANAVDWYLYLYETTSWIVSMPWYPSVVALPELHRPRSFAGQLVILTRCDLLVLAGGATSPHMHKEVEWAKRERIPIVDLTDFGKKPDRSDVSAARAVIARREQLARTAVLAEEFG